MRGKGLKLVIIFSRDLAITIKSYNVWISPSIGFQISRKKNDANGRSHFWEADTDTLIPLQM